MSRTVIITGASDGIGAAAARMLSYPGDTLVLVGRSAHKTKAVASELGADYFVADFTQLEQVRTLAAALLEKYPHIDVLINNAGGIMAEREVTVDGHEKTLQVNHLAPFLLTNLLLERLAADRATVINTSSAANHLMARFDIGDLHGEKKYSHSAAYGNAKLANILFTKELQRRWGGKGINAVAFHPGVVSSNFAAESTSLSRSLYFGIARKFMLTSAQGAETLVWLATTTPGVHWIPGEYYAKRKLAKTNKLAKDHQLAASLWDRSEAMVGLR